MSRSIRRRARPGLPRFSALRRALLAALPAAAWPAGAGAAGTRAAPVQATVKNRHPDGSVAFAILADLQRSGTVVSIRAEGFGTATWQGAGWLQGAEPWISGPRMSSWIFSRPAGTDAHRMLRLELCLYANGEVEVFPYVENGWLMVPGPTHKQARFVVQLNGRTCFDRVVALGHHTRTPLIDGRALAYWTVPEPRVAPRQERQHLIASQRVVRPDPTAHYASWTGPANTSFQPLQRGLFRIGMYGGGHCEGIAPQPGWEVAYLVSDDPLAYESMLRQGWSWGRYSLHYRDEKTGRPIAFSDHPATQMAVPAQGPSHFAGLDTFHTLRYTPAPTGDMPAGEDEYAITHSPAPPYGAYLAKGMSRERSDGLSWGLGMAAGAAGDAVTHTRMAQVFQYLAKGTLGRLGGTGPHEFLYVHQSGQQADPQDRHQAPGTAEALARLRAAPNFAELGAAIRAQKLLACCRSTLAVLPAAHPRGAA